MPVTDTPDARWKKLSPTLKPAILHPTNKSIVRCTIRGHESTMVVAE